MPSVQVANVQGKYSGEVQKKCSKAAQKGRADGDIRMRKTCGKHRTQCIDGVTEHSAGIECIDRVHRPSTWSECQNTAPAAAPGKAITEYGHFRVKRLQHKTLYKFYSGVAASFKRQHEYCRQGLARQHIAKQPQLTAVMTPVLRGLSSLRAQARSG